MPMSNKGLTKLVEECGELIQIASKKIAYIDTDEHPDGEGSMKTRLEEEAADVMASITFVAETFGLDYNKLEQRAMEKYKRFKKWHADPNS